MRRQMLIYLSILSLPVGIAHSAMAVSYTFTTIDVPGADFSYLYGINDAGQIVGWYADANQVPHGFLATPETAPIPEPSTLLFLGSGLAGIPLIRRFWKT